MLDMAVMLSAADSRRVRLPWHLRWSGSLVKLVFYALCCSIITTTASAQGSVPSLLDVIELDNPVKIPPGADCSTKLMEHSFGWSYDKPFIGEFAQLNTREAN
jgi:hypothetical protein